MKITNYLHVNFVDTKDNLDFGKQSLGEQLLGTPSVPINSAAGFLIYSNLLPGLFIKWPHREKEEKVSFDNILDNPQIQNEIFTKYIHYIDKVDIYGLNLFLNVHLQYIPSSFPGKFAPQTLYLTWRKNLPQQLNNLIRLRLSAVYQKFTVKPTLNGEYIEAFVQNRTFVPQQPINRLNYFEGFVPENMQNKPVEPQAPPPPQEPEEDPTKAYENVIVTGPSPDTPIVLEPNIENVICNVQSPASSTEEDGGILTVGLPPEDDSDDDSDALSVASTNSRADASLVNLAASLDRINAASSVASGSTNTVSTTFLQQFKEFNVIQNEYLEPILRYYSNQERPDVWLEEIEQIYLNNLQTKDNVAIIEYALSNVDSFTPAVIEQKIFMAKAGNLEALISLYVYALKQNTSILP